MSIAQPLCVFCLAPLSLHESRAAVHCSRPACTWKYAQLPAKQKCTACGKPLSAASIAAANCGAIECQRTVALEKCRDAERQRREDDERRTRLIEKVRPVAAAAMGIADHGRYPLAVVIGNEPRLIELTAERRQALTRHLNAIVAASESETDTSLAEALDPEMRPELAAVLGQACAMCQGRCCGYGQDVAYLRVGTIRRYRAIYPEKPASEVIEDYLARLAKISVQDSCIYHQTSGCGLTREMRSETCNRHFCQGLKDFRRDVGESSHVQGFFAIVRQGIVESAAFIDKSGTRMAPPIAAEAAPV